MVALHFWKLEGKGGVRKEYREKRGLLFCWGKVFCRQKMVTVPRSFKSVVFLEEFRLQAVSAFSCRVKKAVLWRSAAGALSPCDFSY